MKKLMHALIYSVCGLSTLTAVLALSATNVTLAQQIAQQNGNTPLAKELQGKPVVVEIYASWCPGCKNIEATMAKIKQAYQGRANFVVFDVTDSKTTKASEQTAKKLGLSKFFAANKSQTSLVAVINPANGKVIKQYRNNPKEKDYQTVLDSTIQKNQLR